MATIARGGQKDKFATVERQPEQLRGRMTRYGDYNRMTAWYATLKRPPLTPPDGVFAPVWTVLYITIAVSIILYYRSPLRPHVRLTSTVLLVHLLANFAWTYLFFGLRLPALALADILLLDLSLLVLIRWFRASSAPAGALLLPYLAWILFATYLNYGFFRLNR